MTSFPPVRAVQRAFRLLAEMNRLPNVGESFEKGHWRFEVVDLDGRRIDKLLVSEMEA